MIWQNIECKHSAVLAVEEALMMIITNIDFLSFKIPFFQSQVVYIGHSPIPTSKNITV